MQKTVLFIILQNNVYDVSDLFLQDNQWKKQLNFVCTQKSQVNQFAIKA